MAVNLSKYKTELLNAWKDIVDDKTPNDWALFGYEKQGTDLKVIATGDGGLDELTGEFNCGKIMYAFCKVTDTKTELPKYVFINWQGEGAPLSMKGTCANHVADISNFFKGAHVTINARTEDDVDPSVITEKVAKASASQFNFKQRSDPTENMAPVSSVYKRIQPTREINFTERDKFWEKQQADEKRRVSIEKEKADEERKRLELERREREIRENAARDRAVKERAHSISQLKEAERNADNVNRTQQHEKQQWEQQLQDDAAEEKERRIRSESLRRERSHEAQNLIAKRTINARAIFEQNTSAGQLSTIQRQPSQPKILQEFIATSMNESNGSEINDTNSTSPTSTNNHKEQHPESPKASQFHEDYNKISNSYEIERQKLIDEELAMKRNIPETLDDIAEDEIPSAVETQKVLSSSESDLCARALYDYQAADETEISFDPEDVITQIEQIDEGWWQGRAPDGTYGLFPANYVELLLD